MDEEKWRSFQAAMEMPVVEWLWTCAQVDDELAERLAWYCALIQLEDLTLDALRGEGPRHLSEM